MNTTVDPTDVAAASAPLSPTVRVSDEQVAFFRENGFLAIDAITTPDEIERMRVAYDEIFARRAGREEGMQFDLAGTDEDDQEAALPQILDPRRFSAALRDTLYEVNALAISRQLLGEEARMTGSHAIFKPAGHGAATPWHQDEAYWDPGQNYLSLSVWMPLQEATLENGCMQFVPGSHLLEVLGHHHINHDPRIHGLEVDEGVADLSGAVACPLPAGGATFHLSRTLHYTGPNRTSVPRRAFILGFAVPQPRRDTPRDFPWQREEVSSHTEKQKKR
jgi:ectoine hydroxylase-related dioxygenase (phytanoyl-CoA dioxygenase family)